MIRFSATARLYALSGVAELTAAATVQPSTSPGDPVVVAVGDIARPPGCSPCEQTATAALAQTFNPNAVLVLGDNQYNSGLYSEYTTEHALSWGRDFNSIVHPVPGNHEYVTSGSGGVLPVLRAGHRQPRQRHLRLLLVQHRHVAHRRAQLQLL